MDQGPRVALVSMVILFAFVGCASVDSTPLHPDGTVDVGKARGIRYYVPKPYLLITELPDMPASPTTTSSTLNDQTLGAGGGGGGGGGGTSTSSNGGQSQSNTPTAPSSDTSFSASTANYSVKLIYLPDYSQPMALTMNAGLFGNVALAPSLQDGWMLTSMNGSSDMSAFATLLGSVLGSGGGGASGAKSGTATGGTANAAKAALAASTAQVSPDMTTDQLTQTGRQIGQGTLLLPPNAVLQSLSSSQLAALIAGIISGEATKTTASKAAAPLPWGTNVLPAGLYEFAYAPENASVNAGKFEGIRPLVFFCKTGTVSAAPGQSTPCLHN
jgi:hypothetical protein